MYVWCLLSCNNIWMNVFRWPSYWSSSHWSRCLSWWSRKNKVTAKSLFLFFHNIFVIWICAYSTWMHKFNNKLISFLTLSRISPYIFSAHAVRCCLNSSAGYLASTFNCSLDFPTIPLYPLDTPIPIEGGWNPYNTNFQIVILYMELDATTIS